MVVSDTISLQVMRYLKFCYTKHNIDMNNVQPRIRQEIPRDEMKQILFDWLVKTTSAGN